MSSTDFQLRLYMQNLLSRVFVMPPKEAVQF